MLEFYYQHNHIIRIMFKVTVSVVQSQLSPLSSAVCTSHCPRQSVQGGPKK